MAARITNADLFAALTGVTGKIDSFEARLSALEGSFSTTATVAQATTPTTRKARKAAKAKKNAVLSATGRPLAGAALAKHTAKVAREAGMTPAQIAAKDQSAAQAREAYKARKAALSPLNKALFAQGLTGDAWTSRFSNKPAMEAAWLTLTPAQRLTAAEALQKAL